MDLDDSVIIAAELISKTLGFTTTKRTLFGSAPKQLLEYARQSKSELICIGSHRRSKFNSSLFGSMSRALAISGKESVLIAKGAVPATGPLTVVMTTDHSRYSNRAINRFLTELPSGVKRLILLTVFDKKMVAGVPKDQQEPFLKFLESQGKKVIKKLHASGINAEYKMWEGDLGEVVEAQMDEISADLLIMAAQGNGYSDRLLIGSSALKQVVSSKHSILLLRP